MVNDATGIFFIFHFPTNIWAGCAGCNLNPRTRTLHALPVGVENYFKITSFSSSPKANKKPFKHKLSLYWAEPVRLKPKIVFSRSGVRALVRFFASSSKCAKNSSPSPFCGWWVSLWRGSNAAITQLPMTRKLNRSAPILIDILLSHTPKFSDLGLGQNLRD